MTRQEHTIEALEHLFVSAEQGEESLREDVRYLLMYVSQFENRRTADEHGRCEDLVHIINQCEKMVERAKAHK